MKQKSENQKALPKFLGILVIASLVGGVLGGLSGAAGYFLKGEELGAAITRLLSTASPWAMALCATVLLGSGFYQYRRARTAFRSWDSENEDVIQHAEERLSLTLLLDSLTVIASFFFFNAGIVYLPQEVDSAMIPLLAIFLVVIALSILLQQKTVDLTKEINPEKRGSVYDMKFQKTWMDSCDEAERAQIGQACYRAYMVGTKVCIFLWVALLILNFVFDFGLLPIAAVLAVWGAMQTVYALECIRLSKRTGDA